MSNGRLTPGLPGKEFTENCNDSILDIARSEQAPVVRGVLSLIKKSGVQVKISHRGNLSCRDPGDPYHFIFTLENSLCISSAENPRDNKSFFRLSRGSD